MKKLIEYGGTFGRSLITKERFLSQWTAHISQLNRLPVTAKEFAEVDSIRAILQKMAERQAEQYITESEAENQGIEKYKQD